MKTPFIIDAHMDLAYESLFGQFNYLNSVKETAAVYNGPEEFRSTIGWPEMQKGKFGIIIATIFLSPDTDKPGAVKGRDCYETPEEFHSAVMTELDFYDRWAANYPEKFKLIQSKEEFIRSVQEWENKTDDPEDTRPVGLLRSLEGAEMLRSFEDLDLYWERGLRLIGPVWAGGRWCDGTRSEGNSGFTPEGYQLLRKIESKGLILDLSHMKNRSALDALNSYTGPVIASHANCYHLLPELPRERMLNDEVIRELAAHDGVMGVIPFNAFLSYDWWDRSDLPRNTVTFDTLINHIDHICQVTGSSRHAAFGTDSDGGFGWPAIPEEMNDISDLPKIIEPLQKRGYREEDITNIFHANWQRVFEKALP